MKIDWNKLAPHLAALGVFLVLAFLYSKPLLEGKVLYQSDIAIHRGMAKDIQDHRANYGEEPLWTGSAFSGMPAFTISVLYPSNIVDTIQQTYNALLPHPVRFIFLLALGFYILLLSFKVNPWLSIAGALAFAFSSNFMISIEAGHNSKVVGIAYMPAVVGAAILAFNGRWITGGVLASIFGALLINSGHFQIIFYAMMVLALIGITYLVKAIREKTILHFWKPLLALAIAAIASAGPNYSRLYNTSEHTKETMRGGSSELSSKQGGTGGLDIDYALGQWSYGIDESFTLMFPFYAGGASQETLPSSSETSKLFRRAGQEPGPMPMYRGPQTFHSPIYLGASVFFLFFLSMFIVKGYNRWWIYGAALLSLMIAWGNHFSILNEFLFNNLPLFNKFRTPTMALCIASMAVPLLGMLGLNKISQQPAPVRNMKAFRKAVIVSSVITGIVLVLGLTSDFRGPRDTEIFGENASANELYQALLADRKSFYLKGVFRSVVFLALAAGLIYFFLKKRIKVAFMIGGLAALLLVDVWTISRRYFNDESFVSRTNFTKVFEPSPASRQMLQDPALHYRVLKFSQGMFSDGVTSYNHKNILGNSSAKVQVYQDLIENELGKQINKIPQILERWGTSELLQIQLEQQIPALNMLNTRYIIVNPNEGGTLLNEGALGNAWFVYLIKYVANADEEMQALATFNPEYEAVVQEKYRDLIQRQNFFITIASIKLTQYKINHLTYESENPNPGFAVFSEVYYTNGWNCYIDGESVPIVKTNYALRGVSIPEGKHTIEMKFEPESYPKGERIGTMGSVFFGMVVLGGIGVLFWRERRRLVAHREPMRR